MKQPAIFIPHGGGPCFFLNPDGSCPPAWEAMRDYLARLIETLPERPRAILLISAHWIESEFTVHVGERPELLFDYYGFPAHTYDLRWDAPGAPDVARRAAALLSAAGFATGEESGRGWDHGVFIPMMVSLPGAGIPVAQLSLLAPSSGIDFDADAHMAAGRALAPLRDEGVLIIGSGMSFHNLRIRDGSVQQIADEFDTALTEAATEPDPVDRGKRLSHWADLPHARIAHPPGGEEHLIPLMMVAGAGGADEAVQDFRDQVIGWTVSGYRYG